ncbi:MAG: Cysteine desulfurase IscS [Chlamydiae bacterium]|nr:Cysteine desulfurase IscS [Chlamydiota bacterium]
MIYLDNNATTFLDPQVAETLEAFLQNPLGNPSSIHRVGQRAKGVLFASLGQVAAHFGVSPRELVFTSGATEGLNTLIRSLPQNGHLITSSLEHVAILEAAKQFQGSVTFLDPLEGRGAITKEQVERAIQSSTSLILLSSTNNETGIETDIEAIGEIALQNQIPFAVDAVATLGKKPFKLPPGVGAACFSGHKIHAPQGIGVVVVRKGFPWHPLILGGPQQGEKRGGTENLLGIVGFAKALELAHDHLARAPQQMEELRNLLEEGLLKNLPDLVIHGKEERRIGNISNIGFVGVEGETLLMQLDLKGICVSHGSACSSGTMATSRVLQNMGMPGSVARSSLRFSLSRFTTLEEIEATISEVTTLVTSLRSLSHIPV